MKKVTHNTYVSKGQNKSSPARSWEQAQDEIKKTHREDAPAAAVCFCQQNMPHTRLQVCRSNLSVVECVRKQENTMVQNESAEPRWFRSPWWHPKPDTAVREEVAIGDCMFECTSNGIMAAEENVVLSDAIAFVTSPLRYQSSEKKIDTSGIWGAEFWYWHSDGAGMHATSEIDDYNRMTFMQLPLVENWNERDRPRMYLLPARASDTPDFATEIAFRFPNPAFSVWVKIMVYTFTILYKYYE